MKKAFLTYLKSMILATGILSLSLATLPAAATGVDVFSQGCDAASSSGSSSSSSSSGGVCGAAQQDDFGKLIHNIVNTLLVVLGMIAVIMIVIGGIRYTTSNGDSSQIKAAKDTILYAVVGLVVAILAYAIVNFVLSAFKK